MERIVKITCTAAFGAALLLAACSDDEPATAATPVTMTPGAGAGGAAPAPVMAALSVFVTSDTAPTGNLGGLAGADARCNKLAMAAGSTRKFAAYLSTEAPVVNARDRIGKGPWFNAKNVMVAADLTTLHAIAGNSDLFLDEKGVKINGQWDPTIMPNQHDILTGSDPMGMAMVGKTCMNWTSADAMISARVGHSDGLGPMMSMMPPFASWNSSHDNMSCANTTPLGGAGRLYCFAVD